MRRVHFSASMSAGSCPIRHLQSEESQAKQSECKPLHLATSPDATCRAARLRAIWGGNRLEESWNIKKQSEFMWCSKHREKRTLKISTDGKEFKKTGKWPLISDCVCAAGDTVWNCSLAKLVWAPSSSTVRTEMSLIPPTVCLSSWAWP